VEQIGKDLFTRGIENKQIISD